MLASAGARLGHHGDAGQGYDDDDQQGAYDYHHQSHHHQRDYHITSSYDATGYDDDDDDTDGVHSGDGRTDERHSPKPWKGPQGRKKKEKYSRVHIQLDELIHHHYERLHDIHPRVRIQLDEFIHHRHGRLHDILLRQHYEPDDKNKF